MLNALHQVVPLTNRTTKIINFYEKTICLFELLISWTTINGILTIYNINLVRSTYYTISKFIGNLFFLRYREE